MNQQPIFITGIGTDVGKTIVAAILTEALQADYWKPVQAGFSDGTDALRVKDLISNSTSVIHPEVYNLSLPASPHIAARNENVKIDLDLIEKEFHQIPIINFPLIIEGAGGVLVPLNENEFVIDLIKKLHARVILVSRNYLGSINHSLLTAQVCKQQQFDVLGWIFNDQYLDYEDQIVQWSGYQKIYSLSFTENISQEFVKKEANKIRDSLKKFL